MAAAEQYWTIRYFKRHLDDDPLQTCPAMEFLRSCPDSVRSKFFAVLVAVRDAPPEQFAGGGYWEAMKDEMTGYHEVRLDGPNREHFRLFCILEREAPGWAGPTMVLLCGLSKKFQTTLSAAEYKAVRDLGDEYRSRNPRSLT